MITAILLAAGKSSRIKNKNKLLIKYKGKPLINHILKALLKSKIDKIIIVLGYDYKNVKKKTLKSKKIKFVINKKYRQGVSSSIKLGLKNLLKKNKGFIIALSDMPNIKPKIINQIIKKINLSKQEIFIPTYKNKLGNPRGFKINLIKSFMDIKGDTGFNEKIKFSKKNVYKIKCLSKSILEDFDNINDFNS